MRVIVAGSHTIFDYSAVEQAIEASGFDVTEVGCGRGCGVDHLSAIWAKRHAIPVTHFTGDWNREGDGARRARNAQMGDYGEALLVIWDGQTHSTQHLIEYAREKQLPMKLILLETKSQNVEIEPEVYPV